VQGVTVTPPQTFSGNINFGNGTTCAAGTSVSGDLTTDNSATSTIEVVAPAATISTTSTPNACNGQQTAQINATQTGLTGTLTWSLNPTVGVNNNNGTFEDLSGGTYTVSVSNGSASASTVVTLIDPPVFSNTMTSLVPLLCNNVASGSVTITSTGGTPYSGAPGPYIVELWQGTPSSGTQLKDTSSTGISTFSSLGAGQYFVRCEDFNACIDTIFNITLANPTAISFSANATQINCAVGTGSVALVGTGGTGSLTYLQGTTSVTSPITGLVAGAYTFTATDANGCSATTIGVVNNIPDSTPPTITAAADTIEVCSGTGVNLGTPATADNCSVASVTNNAPTTFPVGATTVTWIVTDASGNTATAAQTVIVFAPIATTLNVIQFGSYVIPGTTTTITTSGIYNQVYTAANTCDSTVTYNVTINGLVICAKAFLSGPYNASTGLMTDSLRQKGILPLSTPYGSGAYTIGYTSVNNTSIETTSAGVLAVTGNNAIVDWVFVQIRSKVDSSIVLGTRSALIQRDGDIVDMDGTSPLTFASNIPDNYFVSIKHRNHIGIMTANNYALSLTANCIDFTNTSTPLFTKPGKVGNPAPLTGPTRIQNGVRTLYAGNCNILNTLTSRFITYNALTTSDRNELYVVTGGTNTLNGYTVYDVDMNGFARFNGFNPDRNVILSNCGGSNNLVTNEQTPN
jgi:hypothetical protein